MRPHRLHPIALLLLACLFGFFGGYVNEAFARDGGARASSHHRGADYRGLPYRGHAARHGQARGRHHADGRRGASGYRRDNGSRDRSGHRRDWHHPFAYQNGSNAWHHDRSYRRDGFAHRDRGWRDRETRFRDHDRRRGRHDRDDYRRGQGRPYTPLPRYDHQYGTEIAPVHRSWNSSSRTVDDDSFIYLGDGPFSETSSFSTAGIYPSGPKWIDVSTDRLDRRSAGRNGIDVAYVGGSKIIRVGPGYSASRHRRHDLQPWSNAWLRHCSASYRSFDPALGTYVAKGGRVRFCNP
ncbi:BA14K family protein [Aureimonas glaciei]|uniref:Lectin-like protein BA14k n=1 Tax=Aureimonas glaciei TaxID=1776957 RepID=A0A917DD82_9HYPH|nr:BA14K family protein [Aureimonas glaciei]GGD28431.1 hypothetical protein GCM10011335_34520 [Aureimonas glaciei]